MRVAITGGTGFLGKYLVRHMVNCGYDVLVIARPIENARDCFDFNIPVFECDYSQESLIKALKGIDTVLHLAAKTMQHKTDPLRVSRFIPINLNITEKIFIAANQVGVKQVFQMSSNAVYSSYNRIPFKESDDPVPLTVYGVSKLYAEKLGEFFIHKTNISIVSLRLARLFGFGERDSVVFTKYMKLASRRDTLEVWGEGKTSIEYIYVRDVVDAIETAVRLEIGCGIYNIGVNKSYSVLEIAELINSVCNNSGNLFINRTKPEGGYHILMDSEKFYKTTNWKPKWKLVDGISEMYNLLQNNND